ncbi:MAG: hypothetical protein ACW96U_08475 [Candidatus Heimdallarchaeaceae archaeon]|jgi:hypothetical protein
MTVTNKTININLEKTKGIGAFYPDVKIESISLYDNANVLKTKQNPHIQHKDEISALSVGSANLASAFTAMEVVLDLYALLPVKNNTHLSFLFDGDITKYLKIGIVQCINKQLHNSISADVYNYVNPKSGLIKKQESDAIKKNTKYESINFSEKLPDYISAALEKEDGTSDFSDLSIQTELPYEKVKSSTGKIHYKIPFKYKMIIPATAGGINVDFLSYFVFTYFDLDELEDSFTIGETGYSLDVDLSPLLEKKLTLGGGASDIVIRNGALDDKSYAYKYSENQPASLSQYQNQVANFFSQLENTWYTGPVHQMANGQWMTGAKHGGPNQESQYYLDKISIPNVKIKDFRQKIELENYNFNLNEFSDYFTNDEAIINLTSAASKHTKELLKKKNPNLFSPMYISRDVNGANRFLFSIDITKSVIANSMFGDLLMKMSLNNQTEFNSLIKKAKITSFKILRKRVRDAQLLESNVVKTNFSKQDFAEMICFSNDGDSGILLQNSYNPVEQQGKEENYKSQIECTISEVKLLNSNTGIRTFTGVDSGVSRKINGKYQYEVQVRMTDPMLGYLENIKAALTTLLQGTQNQKGWIEYMNDMSDPNFSNKISDRFNFAAYDFFSKKYSSTFISSSISLFIENLYKINKVSVTQPQFVQKEMEKYFNFLCNISSANTGSIDGVILTYNIINDFLQKLSKVIATAKGYVKLKEISSSTDPHIENNPNIVANTKEKTFLLKKVFNTLYDASVPPSHGFDFLSSDLETSAIDPFVDSSLKVFTNINLKVRFDLEMQKLFNIGDNGDASTEVNVQTGTALGNLILNPNDTALSTKYTFLSPSIINVSRKRPFFSLGAAMDNRPQDFSEFFIDMYGSKIRQYGFLDLNTNVNGFEPNSGKAGQTQVDLTDSEKQKRYDLIRIFADKGCTIEANPTQAPDTSSIFPTSFGPFGFDVGFASDILLHDFKDYILDTSVNVNKLLSMVLYIDDFALLQGNDKNGGNANTIDFYYPSKVYGGDNFKKQYLEATKNGMEPPLKKAPNHIKALLLATNNPETSKNNIITSYVQQNRDPFRNIDGFPYIMLNHKILSRIEVFKGFRKRNEELNVSDPIFEDLTEQDLLENSFQDNNFMLCRIKRYYTTSYGIYKSENIDLPTLDEYFFVRKVDVAEALPVPPRTEIDVSLGRLKTERAERFETRNPNDLIRPEYIQSGLLEAPRLDDGLSDPLPREQIAAETKKKALESTTGQNEQRLRDKGLGWLLKGYSATGRETNMTANKNATIQTKSAIMQEKRRTTETTNTTGKKSSY